MCPTSITTSTFSRSLRTRRAAVAESSSKVNGWTVHPFTFEDDSATAARLVLKLREKVDVVIEVGHIPAESDSARHAVGGDLPRLARGVRGVDVWFGGHSHNQVD